MSAPEQNELLESMLGDFLDESDQLLRRLNENLLQLDGWVRSLDDDHGQQCDAELLNEMFRAAHSLKGLSAMLGLGDINKLTHKLENVFDAARKQELAVTGRAVDLMFNSVDRLTGLVDLLKSPDGTPVEFETVILEIGELLQSGGKSEPTASSPAAAPQPAQSEPSMDPLDLLIAAEMAKAEAQAMAAANAAPAIPDCFDGLEDDSDIADRYLAIFIEEADTAMDQLSESLASLGNGDAHEQLTRLLVTSHQIKGAAASIGLNRAAKLAHLMEDLLQDRVEARLMPSPGAVDAMLNCVEGLRQFIGGLKKGIARSDHFPMLARELLKARSLTAAPVVPKETVVPSDTPVQAVSGQEAPAVAPITIDDQVRAKVAILIPEDMLACVGRVVFQDGLQLAGLKAQLVYEKLANLGTVCHFEPSLEDLDKLDHVDSVDFGLVCETAPEAIAAMLRIGGVSQVAVESLTSTKSSLPTPAPKAAASSVPAGDPVVPHPAEPPRESAARAVVTASPTKQPAVEKQNRPTETLRVDVERLDELMNLAGQLVISKARFTQIGESLSHLLASRQCTTVLDKTLEALNSIISDFGKSDDPRQLRAQMDSARHRAERVQEDLRRLGQDMDALPKARGSVGELLEAIHQLDRISDGIQQSVMQTRMVPIGPLLNRFKRVVRDITRTCGKSIRLDISGENTELDKRMIDELADPLIHLVRNAVDHGIEAPEVREAAGKPREGRVHLDAFHRGNSIVIQLGDDGKGLDSDRILRKCLERGILTPADAEKMTPAQIYQMIWEPGVSTAEKVTEISGRGMGMDIVKSKIEQLNGTVEMVSAPGKGTTFTIKLPLTLAILPGLMVEIDGDVYVIPMESVTEIVRPKATDLATIHGLPAVRVRQRVLSVVKLAEAFTWVGHGGNASRPTTDETILVIVGENENKIGLAVDRVIGEEDVVIKSVNENYRNVAGIAGASILGDGRVSLILDVPTLIDMASTAKV